MHIELLNDSGLTDKYYQWKDLFIHSILKPVLTITDDRHSFHVFAKGMSTTELIEKCGKDMLQRIDNNFNHMLYNHLAFMVELAKDSDIELATQAGYIHPAIFTVFKDDLLKANPTTPITSFVSLVPNTILQEKLK